VFSTLRLLEYAKKKTVLSQQMVQSDFNESQHIELYVGLKFDEIYTVPIKNEKTKEYT
jgi:hypothetical protein